ncbi:MAG: PatB family C-S lyase [Bacteroidales bacterium]|jgi:cystathionine beta-lyase|nr:PatB family C-S lyase [Bacteroidales bacterium]
MTYDFDKQIDRSETSSIKYDLRKTIFGSEEVLPMWVADMDFETPDFIRDAVKARAEHPIYGYTFRNDSYHQAQIDWFKKRYDWEIEKDWIVFTPGIVPALNMAVLALTNRGDKIIVQPPVYFPFFTAVSNHNRELVNNELIKEDGTYRMNFEQLEEQAADARMLILCNPHNPVGRAWRREELDKLADICVRHNLLVISDEIHADLVLPGHKHTPFASVHPGLKASLLTMHAASKTFNLAGLATSSVIIEDETLRNQFKQFVDFLHVGMGNIFGAVATETAFREGGEWHKQMLHYVSENVNYFTDQLSAKLPQLKVFKPEATYMVWLDFNAFGLDDVALKSYIIKEAGLGLNAGIDFGSGGSGFMRINLACPRQTVELAVEKLILAFSKLS